MGERNLLRELMDAHARLRYAVAEADRILRCGLPKVVSAMAKEEAVIAEMRKAAGREGDALDLR